MDWEIVRACSQTIYTLIPVIVLELEVAFEFTKLAAFQLEVSN